MTTLSATRYSVATGSKGIKDELRLKFKTLTKNEWKDSFGREHINRRKPGIYDTR